MRILVTNSLGSGPTKLAAFDDALVKAGIANFNLVKLSSIIPPESAIWVKKGKIRNKLGNWGDRLYVVMAEMRVDTPNKEAWAGIGWVRDKKTGKGIFVEHEGSSEESVRKDIKDSLQAMLAKRPGIKGNMTMMVIGGVCRHEPICALAIAVYESESWQS